MEAGDANESKAEDVVMEEKEEVGGESGKDGDSEMKNAELDGKKEATEENGQKEEAEGEKEEEKSSKKKKMSNNGEEDEEKEEEAEKKEPVTPNERPTRERKTVERYSEPSVTKSATPKSVSIVKGRGEKLSEIPNVAYKLSKRKADDNLQLLHTILFGKKAKVQMIKRNIGQFSGFVWSENEDKQKAKVKERIDKCMKEKLIDFCYVLDIPITKATAKKEELSVKLMEFLQLPHATTEALLADAEQKKKNKKKKKRKVTPTKADESSGTPAKKRKASSEASKKTKKSSKVSEVEEQESEEAHHDGESSDDEEQDVVNVHTEEKANSEHSDDDVSKKKSDIKGSSKKKSSEAPIRKEKPKISKETTPAKSTTKADGFARKGANEASAASGSQSKAKGSASKKQSAEKEKETKVQDKDKIKGKRVTSKLSAQAPAKNQGKGKVKKSKEPTRDEMHAVVVDILKEVDFNTATLSDILRQLGTHFNVNLLNRKAEVKEIITEVISNMTDDEEDEQEGKSDPKAEDKEDEKEKEENMGNKHHVEKEMDESVEDQDDKDNKNQEDVAVENED